MTRALILRAENHEFTVANEKLVPLSSCRVVLTYEDVEKTVRRRAVMFTAAEWELAGLPEPEDFIGHLVEYPQSLCSFIKHWQEEVARKHRPILAVDFDGVMAEYDGWKGDKSFGEPLDNLVSCLQKIRDAGWWICIWTTREPVGVWHYCTTKGIPVDSVNCIMFRPWAKKKICADVYLDDRGMQFLGKWDDELVERILNFRPHWQYPGHPESFEPT